MNLTKSLLAEFLGTGWLVFGGCGAAVLAAALIVSAIFYPWAALHFWLASRSIGRDLES